ncbi:hypothetical protein F5Y17DRAFT_207670 [Xylariaceae sp. FL0594]|nr:hypothetical protein F5Y17DRAFT_207670 [Xylariaceae sp. FL0594]
MSVSGFTNTESNPGHIINQDGPQPSAPYIHPHPLPEALAHAHAQAQAQAQAQASSHYRQQQYSHPVTPVHSVAPFNSSLYTYQGGTVPTPGPALAETRSTLTSEYAQPYEAIPSYPPVHQHVGSTPGEDRAIDLSQSFDWASATGPSSHQKGERIEASQSLTAGLASDLSGPPGMRYLTGSLDVLSAERYNDGRFPVNRGLPGHDDRLLTKAGSSSNPKKRGRKAPQNEQTGLGEETKRARGRPRLEEGGHQDMKERRKQQIRLAQRAYRNRKETAISELESCVAEYKASHDTAIQEVRALLELADKHETASVIPEIYHGLRRLYEVLQKRVESTRPASEDRSSRMKPGDLDSGKGLVSGGSTPKAALSPSLQRPQQLYGGIIVTLEPEQQSASHESDPPPPSSENEHYTVVRVPSQTNSSYLFDMDYLNSHIQDRWPLDMQMLGLPWSGAYLESSLGRKLHRRATEKAARLLSLKSPPYEVMHRAFGFVRNYSTLDQILQRVEYTLALKADEDLNVYSQPFHNVGGSGTHYPEGAKVGPSSNGAPFPNAGFGMGPFNERTTRVRDELLDALQRAQFPGWEGEWLDSYDVQMLLTRSLVALPQGGEGFVDVLPGDLYHNPLEEKTASPRTGSLQVSHSRGRASDFNTLPSISNAESVPGVPSRSYMLTPSSVPNMHSITATESPWPLNTAQGVGLQGVAQSLSSTIPTGLSFDNSLIFSDSPSNLLYPSSNLNFDSGQPSPKRVWFSTDKFIESLGVRGTCLGRGPAFRKHDVVIAFWETVSLEAT